MSEAEKLLDSYERSYLTMTHSLKREGSNITCEANILEEWQKTRIEMLALLDDGLTVKAMTADAQSAGETLDMDDTPADPATHLTPGQRTDLLSRVWYGGINRLFQEKSS